MTFDAQVCLSANLRSAIVAHVGSSSAELS